MWKLKFILVAMMCFMGATMISCPAHADALTLTGSTIPLRGVSIEEIVAGRLYYRDHRGLRQWRDLKDVTALAFDELPELEEAEEAMAANDPQGLRQLLRALLAADRELEKLWLRIRLVNFHKAQGDYVLASAHAAAAFQIRDDPGLASLEPFIDPDQPDFAALHEAIEQLGAAKQKVKNDRLRTSINRMLEKIQPIYDARAQEYDGPAIASGNTLSGITLAKIRGEAVLINERETKPTTDHPRLTAPAEPPAGTRAPAQPPSSASRTVTSGPGAHAPEAIERLIAEGRTAAALEICESVATDPGDRPLSTFLYQYGRCLRAENRLDDAVLMHTRCAVLYPQSEHASAALIETAAIYESERNQPAAAKRLLERAITLAQTRSDDESVERARDALSRLKNPPGSH